jgi:hypothetical protein
VEQGREAAAAAPPPRQAPPWWRRWPWQPPCSTPLPARALSVSIGVCVCGGWGGGGAVWLVQAPLSPAFQPAPQPLPLLCLSAASACACQQHLSPTLPMALNPPPTSHHPQARATKQRCRGASPRPSSWRRWACCASRARWAPRSARCASPTAGWRSSRRAACSALPSLLLLSLAGV